MFDKMSNNSVKPLGRYIKKKKTSLMFKNMLMKAIIS